MPMVNCNERKFSPHCLLSLSLDRHVSSSPLAYLGRCRVHPPTGAAGARLGQGRRELQYPAHIQLFTFQQSLDPLHKSRGSNLQRQGKKMLAGAGQSAASRLKSPRPAALTQSGDRWWEQGRVFRVQGDASQDYDSYPLVFVL